MAEFDAVWTHCSLATMADGAAAYGAVEDGALAVKDGRIAYVGPRSDLPGVGDKSHDAGGAWITPGLIDCHTHLVFAGDRAGEFEQRLEGASYEEIARAGGGIISTVKATRAASLEDLVAGAVPRLTQMMAEGVTTVEIKSGYGLDTITELRMLQAATELGARYEVDVLRTFLGAHALPPEYADSREGYVDLVCKEMLPSAAKAGLVDAVDAFCENIGFTADEVELVFDAARALGLPVKLHAEQLSDQGGTQLAARYNALSADHLEYVSDEGVAAMAAAGMTAVLLPGAFYFLRETKLPPIEALRKAGVPFAIATDCNPGSSPLVSPLLTMNMACTLFRLTPEEALAGMTRNAARALGQSESVGTLEVGKQADFCLWNISQPAELSYWMGNNPLAQRVKSGRTTHQGETRGHE